MLIDLRTIHTAPIEVGGLKTDKIPNKYTLKVTKFFSNNINIFIWVFPEFD